MDALTILGGIQAALKIGKEAKSNLELREIISDARQSTLDLRETLQDQQEEIRSLRNQIATREALTFDREANIYRDNDGSPFCPCTSSNQPGQWTAFSKRRFSVST